ncbi:hypothetical protein NECID01_1333 [Nematocida sp. AWRm77]|nr:hypothetical protein NECID01_1333 [Nematocida sp. AWRm77]
MEELWGSEEEDEMSIIRKEYADREELWKTEKAREEKEQAIQTGYNSTLEALKEEKDTLAMFLGYVRACILLSSKGTNYSSTEQEIWKILIERVSFYIGREETREHIRARVIAQIRKITDSKETDIPKIKQYLNEV